MQRQVCWVEKLEDDAKREVRVGVQGGQVKWQFKLSTELKWDYNTPPTLADWDNFMERMENRYQRRNIKLSDLELVRRLHKKVLEAKGQPSPDELRLSPSPQ